MGEMTISLLPTTATASASSSSSSTSKPSRHHGYDNCKFVFMLLVVLWHVAHMQLIERAWKQSKDEASIPWWDLHRHSSWIPFITHVLTRYWVWTEKIAVPGFFFLSGYFGKGFLPQQSSSKQHADSSMDPAEQLLSLQRSQAKDKVRWEKTISTLLLGPLLWQVLAWLLGRIVTGVYTHKWSLDASPKLELWDHLHSWYLFALLIWRTWTTLFLSRLRQDRHFPLMVSMVLSLLSTHTQLEGPQEMRMRVFFFFPYYVAGLYFQDNSWHALIQWSCRLCRICIQSKRDLDRVGQYLGCFGIALTLLVCQFVNRWELGWSYHIDNYQWRPHVVWLLQYLLTFCAVISVIMVIKPIQSPLFPFGHANSTLAIYEGHFSVANWLAWGNLPFAEPAIKAMQVSWVKGCFSALPPIPAALGVHLICYMVCVFFGSRVLWDKVLRHICDPEWACRWIFVSGKESKIKPESCSKDPPHQEGTRGRSDSINKACQV